MALNKELVMSELAEMERKLDETVTSIDRGPVKDAMRLVVPMMKDQIHILKVLVDASS